jgi:hypothetical protein
MKPIQNELVNSAEVFNLAPEVGADPDRILREQLQAATDRAAAREYELKMQRTFAQCPGFCGSDDPHHVVVEPALALEAFKWLRRRFHVNERLEVSTDTGLCIEVKPRQRRLPSGVRRVKVSFGPVEQFTLAL